MGDISSLPMIPDWSSTIGLTARGSYLLGKSKHISDGRRPITWVFK